MTNDPVTSGGNIPLDYAPPVADLLALGQGKSYFENTWSKYLEKGFTNEHIPELIRMMTDDSLLWADQESSEVWAPLHAWRILGQLRAQAAIGPIIGMLHYLDERQDDWMADELPLVLGLIGAAAIFPLRSYLINESNGPCARETSASALKEIAIRDPHAYDECVSVLIQQMDAFAANSEDLNGSLVSAFLDLGAAEAVPSIKRAFDANAIPYYFVGDWEDVLIGFGLLEKRLTPEPKDPWIEQIQQLVDTRSEGEKASKVSMSSKTRKRRRKRKK